MAAYSSPAARLMKSISFVLLAMIVASTAHAAQGVECGADEGATNGAAVAGPVGAVVGEAVGAVTGGVAGLLGIDQKVRFREFLAKENLPSFPYQSVLRPGLCLSVEDITYYPVPAEFGVSPDYRYAIINGEAVIVDPRTRRIIQVID